MRIAMAILTGIDWVNALRIPSGTIYDNINLVSVIHIPAAPRHINEK